MYKTIDTILFQACLMLRFSIALSFFFLAGCIQYNPAWNNTDYSPNSHTAEDLLREAAFYAEHATNNVLLNKSMDAYKQVLHKDPFNEEALHMLANQHILMGAAYCDSIKSKEIHYKHAMRLCELAMWSDPAFRTEIKNGKRLWDACLCLDENYMPCMTWWVTAFFYYYEECLSPPAVLMNSKWLPRTKQILEHAYSIDSEWGDGVLLFSLGIYYLAVPSFIGGDLEISGNYFEKAVQVGNLSLLPRWARAKYYCRITGNTELLKEDLQWLLDQDLSKTTSPQAWNAFIQRDAEQMMTTFPGAR